MSFETDYIKKVTKILVDNRLTEITLEDENCTLFIKKDNYCTVEKKEAQNQNPKAEESTDKPLEQEIKVEEPKGKPILSPMVGTFYAKPSPKDVPFVEIGSVVSKGQVVCIIEAMKLMNEIESEVEGKVIQICVENGDNVEYGQVLMLVE